MLQMGSRDNSKGVGGGGDDVRGRDDAGGETLQS